MDFCSSQAHLLNWWPRSNDKYTKKGRLFLFVNHACGREMGFVLQFPLCRVVCSARRCTELRLLTLYELLLLAGTSIDLVTTEQRQNNKKGRSFSFVKHVCGRKWGLYYSLHCAAWYAQWDDAQNCPCYHSKNSCFFAGTSVALVDAT